MKIGIIGMGFVGGATAEALKKHHEIIPYDKYKKEYQEYVNLKNAEAIFICVPTPMKPSGEIDYSAIYNSVELLEKIFSGIKKKPLIIIRSTAVSGTTKNLQKKYSFRFAFNPEFLREKTAIEDMLNTDRVVLGAEGEEDFNLMKKIYQPIFPNANYILTNTDTAEMIKYASNVTLAGQISVANEIYQICQVVGVNYEDIKNTLLLDKRIGNNINVPGHDGDFGFGGKCFPKDLNALIYLARENMYRPYLLEEIWRLNERVRKNKDWLNIKGATSGNNFN